MRVWHSAWSWLNEIMSADSVAGKTFTGMLTRLTFRKPFHVGRGGIRTHYRLTRSKCAQGCTKWDRAGEGGVILGVARPNRTRRGFQARARCPLCEWRVP